MGFIESLNSSGNGWQVGVGPGGKHQWHPALKPEKKIFRLTSDIALLEDPSYLEIVQEFADNATAFNEAFDEAWFKLTTTNVAENGPSRLNATKAPSRRGLEEGACVV